MTIANELNKVYGSFDPWSPERQDLDRPLAETLWKINPWEHWQESVVQEYSDELALVRQLQEACLACLTRTACFGTTDMEVYCFGLINYSRLPRHVKLLILGWIKRDTTLSITKVLTRVLGLILCYISAPSAFDCLKGEN